MARKKKSSQTVASKLVGVADQVIAAAHKKQDPTLSIPVRSLPNVSFNARKGIIEMGQKKQARSFFNVWQKSSCRRSSWRTLSQNSNGQI